MQQMNVNVPDSRAVSNGMQTFRAASLDEPEERIYRRAESQIGKTEEELELNDVVILGYN